MLPGIAFPASAPHFTASDREQGSSEVRLGQRPRVSGKRQQVRIKPFEALHHLEQLPAVIMPNSPLWKKPGGTELGHRCCCRSMPARPTRVDWSGDAILKHHRWFKLPNHSG